MLVREPGKVTDRIAFLGTRKICLYLLKGREAMIIGGGMSWIVPSLEKQLSMVDFDPEKIKYLVIPHSHFDHCGAVPYLKRKFPQMQILASAYSQEVFSKEKAVNFIANSNKEMIDKLGLQDQYQRLNLQFNGIRIDRVVAENDTIDLGDGIEAHFMEVPGHTKCCIATYVPKLKAMFPSDAAPWPTDDGSELSFPSPQYDFSSYLESLRRLSAHEVEICGFDHHGVFVAEQAQKVLQQGLERAKQFREDVIAQYQQTNDWDEVAERFAAQAVNKEKFSFISSDLQMSMTKTVIRKVLS